MLLSDVDQLRAELTRASSMAVEDASAYARQVVDESPERAAAQLREAVPSLVTVYGGVAAESAALFYETQRPSFRPAQIAPLSIGDELAQSLGWALVPIFTPDEFDTPVLDLVSRIAGVTQKHTAAGSRDTLILSSSTDPDSGGVRRYARAGACAFCRYLTVAEADVDEQTVWHDNCHCVTVPWWEDNPLPEDPNVAEWGKAAEWARTELERLQFEAKPADMRWRNFFKQRPDLAINTKNISRLMRERLGISH